ncbi:putative beta-lactamase-like 1 [Styela clava]
MSKIAILSVFTAILSITTVAFAALFTWQYITNTPSGDNPTNPNTTTNTGCPYYPTPQEIDFANHEEFKKLFDWIDSHVASLVDENARPSVTANLVYLDKIVWSGYYGRVNKSTTVKPDENTIYRIASISKIFPVLFLFKLWEDGKLDLYDPVTKYAPDFSIGRPLGTTNEINLIDIASQISGLASSLPFNPLNGSAIFFNGQLEDALQLLQSQILVAEPRSTCFYSNLAYALLGHILARNFTTDGNFENWAKQNIADKLDLTNTGFTYTADVRAKMAAGYLPSGVQAPVYELLWYSPAGNYYSTIADLAKLSMSFMETSKTVLKHETLTEILRPRKTCRHDYLVNMTGSPWEMNKLHDYLVVSKNGALEGYTSDMAMIPDLKLSFNILRAGFSSEDTARIVLDKAIPLFRDTLRKMQQKIMPAPNPEKYVGFFSYYNLENQTISVNENGILIMRNSQSPPQALSAGLSYISETVFQLLLMGSGFPCIGNLDKQNGGFVHFKEFVNGKYNQFDFPETYAYGFKRV